MVSKRISKIREAVENRGSLHAGVIYQLLVTKIQCLNHLERDSVLNRGITNEPKKG